MADNILTIDSEKNIIVVQNDTNVSLIEVQSTGLLTVEVGGSIAGLPPGGAVNSVLTKASAGAYDTAWELVDHNNVLNNGTNTHAQIDTHIADTSVHFTVGSITLPEAQIAADYLTYASQAQGGVADSAVQPGDNVSTLTNDSAFISDIVQDISPQLGADLDTNSFQIKGTTPVAIDDLTRKDYVDDTTVSISGDTMTGDLTVGGTSGSNSLTIANPGVGNTSTLDFAKTSDSASIKVTEWAADQTEYQFYMADNPQSTFDKFNWFADSWRGQGNDWKPLELSGYTSTLQGQSVIVRGNLAVGNLPYISTEGIDNAIVESKTGIVTATFDVSGFTEAVNKQFYVVLTTDGTTFSAYDRKVTSGQVTYLTDYPVTPNPTPIQYGVTVSFDGFSGDVGDEWTIGAWNAGILTSANNIEVDEATPTAGKHLTRKDYVDDKTTWVEYDAAVIGNTLSVNGGQASLATLNSTDIAFIDDGVELLKTYRFDGTDWTQVGNPLSIPSINSPALTGLNSTDVAFIDGIPELLTTYRFDGTDWTQVGNTLSIPSINAPGLASLNSTDVAFIDWGAAVLKTYRFDGTNWAQVGNTLSVPGMYNLSITALNSTDVAVFDYGTAELRTYRFDGTDWAQIGISLTIAATGSSALTALNSTDVVFIERNAELLTTYRFDGTNWTQVGKPILIPEMADPALTTLTPTDVVFFASAPELLTTYRFTDVIGNATIANDINKIYLRRDGLLPAIGPISLNELQVWNVTDTNKITLKAPATTTDHTLTLPELTGTLMTSVVEDTTPQLGGDLDANGNNISGITPTAIDHLTRKDYVDGEITAHTTDTTIHFTEGSIDHTNIQNIGTNTHAQLDTHVADTSIHFTEADFDMVVPTAAMQINSPTDLNNINKYISHIWSPTVTDGALITDNLDGTVDIGQADITIRGGDEHTQLYTARIPATAGVTLTDNSPNIIYADWNAGNPVIAVTTDPTIVDIKTKVPMYLIVREGNTLTIVGSLEEGVDANAKLRKRLFFTEQYKRVGGGSVISETGSNNLACTAGAFYFGLRQLTHDAIDTSITGNFWYYRLIAGSWVESNETQYDNLQYNDISVSGSEALATLGNNKYAVHWVYVVPNDVNTQYAVIYSQDTYNTFSDAEAAGVPSVAPPSIATLGQLLGRYIVKKGDATGVTESIWTETFTAAVPVTHNDLAGLQGGALAQYYHLDLTEHTDVLAHIVDGTKHRLINDASTLTTELFSASKITTELATKEPANANIQSHIADGTIHYPQSAISITESQISDFGTYIPATEKAAANGVATLGADSKIPSAQLPAIAITDTFVVADQAARLALTAQTGDVAVQQDVNESYILQGTDPSLNGDWVMLLTPTDSVLSVNSKTGTVVLTTTDIAEGTNQYYTEGRVTANTDVTANTSARHTHANTASLDLVSGTNTGDETKSSIDALNVDADTLDGKNSLKFLELANDYVAGHNAEGRYMQSAGLTNDFANARHRGSVFTFTAISPSNAKIDAMFSTLSDNYNINVAGQTAGGGWPIVIEFTVPRLLKYGLKVGIGFGTNNWRCNAVKIEAFSEGAWVTCVDTTTNTSEDVYVNVPGNSSIGTTAVRYTLGDPNTTQMRINHLWAANYQCENAKWIHLPRVGGELFGSLDVTGQVTASDAAPLAIDDLTRKDYVDAQVATKIGNVVEDTTPQLGADLDTNGNNITGTDNSLEVRGGDTAVNFAPGSITISGGNNTGGGRGGTAYINGGNATGDHGGDIQISGGDGDGTLQTGGDLFLNGGWGGNGATSGSVRLGYLNTNVINASKDINMLVAAPTLAEHLTRKDYVDGEITALSSVYEPADATILKDADIGVTVAPFAPDLIHVQPTTVQGVGGATGTITAINWDTVPLKIDTPTFTHDPATNSSRVTVDVTGRYTVMANIVTVNLGPNRQVSEIYLRVNGSTNITRCASMDYSRGSGYEEGKQTQINTEIELNATDYVEVMHLQQDSDASNAANTVVGKCELIMRRIG